MNDYIKGVDDYIKHIIYNSKSVTHDTLKKEYICSEKQAFEYIEVLYANREGREHIKYICEKYGVDKKQITKLKLKI
jgi:hypothetical protein